jgi:uncharacterized phage-associated protein
LQSRLSAAEGDAMSLAFRPNLEKIVELLLYLAHKKPGSDKYQAVKFFYLADREHLVRHGRPITFETYYALPYGPVASKAKELLEQDRWTMKAAGISSLPFETETVQRKGPVSDLLLIGKPLREVDFDLFSKSDIRVFDEVLQQYGHLSFQQLFDLTHDHFAYKRAWKGRGHLKAAPMRYEDMIDDEALRKRILEDVGPVAAHI